MENERAGLDLVSYIRDELRNKDVRIILRTGQPGQAPEKEVIIKYDINDYKQKSELTVDRLFTSLIAALRSYEDLVTISNSRQGLQDILEGSGQLFRNQSVHQFLSGVLTQINAIFHLGDDAMLYVRNLASPGGEEKVMAASGKYDSYMGQASSSSAFPSMVRAAIADTLARKASSYEPGRFSIYFYSASVYEIVIYIDSGRELNTLDIEMIDIYCANVSLGLANADLLETLEAKVVGRTCELAQANAGLEQRTRELESANDQLRQMAMTDPLTGIFNRRYLLDMGTKLFSLANRYNWDLSVLLIDIDHFKAINDTHGHAAGDAALIQLAGLVRKRLRDSDVFGRIGGEEFVVIAPSTNAAAAAQLSQRLMETLAAADIGWEGIALKFTVSIGIACSDRADKSIEATMARADSAMYQAKHAGRNRYVLIEAPVDPRMVG
ncbi:GGDEF domain-containing protein [Massilia glaciei]|uniref:diguanylate cyclase n=2 Tax=Massilia glaciei TaxID=1524097 RepID=A0A2U2HN63_9BURK|nr:GGDEF domain-containing protein [Massilia glaciei]